ncbi:DUF4886 domain-containing protein [Sphingobacterium hotanense]|nr:DUF4886 domain-containing protein [Sphingobacterium hotanense]
MKLKWIGLCISLSITMLSQAVQAQEKDSLVFLGDTLSLTPKQIGEWEKSGKQYLRPVNDQPSKFIINKLGTLSFEGQRFQIADPLDDGVTKVLVIGNSFSDDGVEYYLHDLAKQTGKPLVIGNLFRGGAPLDFHLKNALEDIAIYDYRKTFIDGAKINTRKTSILSALKDENWDIICFQQASVLSGDLTSVQKDLPELFNYVQANYPISSVRYAYHQTWAYAKNASTKNFEKYNRDQNYMFQQIVQVAKEVKHIMPVDILIPSGTAIQNGRTSYIEDNFTREGYHLDLKIGRFTAACAWYESLFGDLENNSFKPFNLSKTQAAIAREAAINAVKNPFVETVSAERLKKIEKIAFATIQVNFGADLVMPGWNSFLFEKANTKLSDLSDNQNKNTDVSIRLLQNFDARAANGPQRTATNFKMPAEVSKSYFIVRIDKENQKSPFLEIAGLDSSKSYKINIYAAQNSQQNPLFYWIKSEAIKGKKSLNSSFNLDKTATFEAIKPTKDGKLFIGFELTKGIQDATAVINALSITESPNK